MPLTLSDQDANQLVDWLSQIGDLSYMLGPDPNPVGVGQRLRIQSCKHILHADPPPPPPPPPPAPTLLYDSTTASDIPANAQLVAGYVDGAYAWSKADWARFNIPDSQKITITVFGGQMAAVCDCETGDLTPDQAAAWIQQYPGNIVYCNLSTAPAVVKAMQNAGLTVGPNPQFYLWIADWTGQAHIPSVPGAIVVACQYADPVTSGGHYDLSVVTPEFLDLF